MSSAVILAVDDHRLNLKVIRALVEAEGYTVHTALDAPEALTVLRTVRPHLILLDLCLPGMDGLQLARQLKADPATRDIPIVGLTAATVAADVQALLDAGCAGHIA